jgi:cohesin complex subunit SA-1/2
MWLEHETDHLHLVPRSRKSIAIPVLPHTSSWYVMLQAYLTMCDLLVVFCDQLASNPQLSELVYEPDRGLQIQLNDFIQNYVFIMEEDGKLVLSNFCY